MDDKYLKRTVNKETVPSRYLPEGERKLRVFLPPGYNEVLSYPVVFCQDGEDFFNFGRVATIANQLILDEGVEPFIIVGVDVDKSVRTEEYSPDGNRYANYVRFFAEELLPFIESKYPVRRERSERLLAGDSLGGTVSLHIALEHPELFNRVLSLSGAFYPASRNLIAATSDLSWLDIYMTVGLQENAYETDRGIYDFVALNRNARILFEERGAKTTYFERDGKHTWGFWQKDLPAALAYFLDR
ncbi:alpha/beta hydrolase [Paenibacillus xylaniclasticus]|uniref:alpha/beta hydrolase n=1 Tax=Paenibacillus xylaniclasticus TaxID=588083 RepID=UPI000FDC1A9A|nr:MULTISPECIES: alpha/beta hydrolase-fold protein [Paenibacillus]GFN32349.1 hypothetical protein PCURB6_26090 [Paenibacillus curdlanolyticus]